MTHTSTTSSAPTTAELMQRIENGITAVQSTEEFKRYLRTASAFHHYSLGNVMLIMWQRPTASQVAGFNTWLKVKRAVRKGEHGIRILAPIPYRVKNDDGSVDEDSERRVGFKTVSVFDIAQTDGEPLPEPPAHLLDGDSAGLLNRLGGIAIGEGLRVSRNAVDALGSANGYYTGSMIWVRPDVSDLQAAKTMAHELGHHFASHTPNDCREERETVAEAVAFMVLAHFGLDSGDYSFGYLAGWSDVKTLRSKLAEIQKAASAILTQLDASADVGITDANE